MGTHPTVAPGVDPAAQELYPDTLGIGVFGFCFFSLVGWLILFIFIVVIEGFPP